MAETGNNDGAWIAYLTLSAPQRHCQRFPGQPTGFYYSWPPAVGNRVFLLKPGPAPPSRCHSSRDSVLLLPANWGRLPPIIGDCRASVTSLGDLPEPADD